MQPGQHHTNAHYVTKDETGIEGYRRDVVQEHLTPVVVSLDQENVSEQVLHMIAKSEQDVTVDAWRYITEQSLETSVDGSLRIVASKEVWQPKGLLHHRPSPERRETEIAEADQVFARLSHLALPSIVISFVGYNAAEDWVTDAVDYFFHEAEGERANARHP